jgi:hypothetical protein
MIERMRSLKTSVLRISNWRHIMALLFTIGFLSVAAQAQSIRFGDADEKGFNGMGTEGNITIVSSPRREGKGAFRHYIPNGGNRAELVVGRLPLGTYWYGWSFMHPSSPGVPSGGWTILSQWFVGGRDASSWPCGGAGHKVGIENKSGGYNLKFDLQYSTNGGSDITCKPFNLASWDDVKDKWVDVVVHAKWTANTDGFVKLWIRIGGDSGTWVQKVDYKGRSQANGNEGPYFKFGAYTDKKGPRVVYTDAFEQHGSQSRFEDVAPGGKGGNPTPEPELTHTIQLQKNWNLISLPINPKDTDIADVLAPINGQYAAVHAYDGKEYESYYPGDASSKLKTMQAGRGYWIFMSQAVSLLVKGTRATKSITFDKEWNLVGYNSTTPMSATQALASTGGKVAALYSYNNATNTYEVAQTLQPGVGYWLYATEGGNWSLP